MLTRRTRNKVLKAILAADRNCSNRLWSLRLREFAAFNEKEFYQAAATLHDLGLIVFTKRGDNLFSIDTTAEGRTYFVRRWDEAWSFLRRSFFVPIIVAVIVSIITTIIYNQFFVTDYQEPITTAVSTDAITDAITDTTTDTP